MGSISAIDEKTGRKRRSLTNGRFARFPSDPSGESLTRVQHPRWDRRTSQRQTPWRSEIDANPRSR